MMNDLTWTEIGCNLKNKISSSNIQVTSKVAKNQNKRVLCKFVSIILKCISCICLGIKSSELFQLSIYKSSIYSCVVTSTGGHYMF